MAGMRTIKCPYCYADIAVPKEFIGGVCPICGKAFKIRKGRTHKDEEVVDESIYYLVKIFSNIAVLNPIAEGMYRNFIIHFIEELSLTRLQMEDVLRIYAGEKNILLRSGYKKNIKHLKRIIDFMYAERPLKEQELVEDNILNYLIRMISLDGSAKQEQTEIIDKYRKVFKYSR